jgi:chromosome segregation ATPase
VNLPNTIRLACMSVCLVAASGSHAQSARSGGGPSASQQIIAQMQQVARERDQAQADVAKLKQDLAAGQDQLAKIKAELEGFKARAVDPGELAKAQREAQQSSADLERVRNNVSDLTKQLRETALQLRDSENLRSSQNAKLSAELRAHTVCVKDNSELSALALDVLVRYERSVGSKEPFLRISRVRAQNFADEYHAKVDDLKAPIPSSDAESH